MRGYFICTTPRSGSNYLCQLLASTGALGDPLEYFNPSARRALEAPNYPDDALAQVDWMLTKGATANGVYGCKLFADQLHAALQQTGVTALLPRLSFVRLMRRDILGQAISWARALQTGQYRSTQAAQGEASFDAELIARKLGEIASGNASWDIYFARTGVAPLTLWYEEIEADPQAAVGQVAALLDAPGPAADPAAVRVARQRDAASEAWRARFLRECGGLNLMHLARPPEGMAGPG